MHNKEKSITFDKTKSNTETFDTQLYSTNKKALFLKHKKGMKILFLIFHGFSEYSGISKKIRYQVNGLKEAGHEVDLCYYTVTPDGYRLRMINEQVIDNYGCGWLAPIKKRFSYKAIINYAINSQTELVYMRSDHNANPFTIAFLNKLKKNCIKTVMEIPTYPYDQEYKGLSLQFQLELLTDKCFRKCLAKQLFRIVTFTEDDTIFNAKTIKISNGIDFNEIKLKSEQKKTESSFHLIGVAEVHPWHGFGEYYKNKHEQKVYFHVIGGIASSEMFIFKQIIQKYNIEDYIIFHGTKFGKELDDLFEQANFGIASLARHRSKITHIKTLKNREYAARGIPFIYSEIDSDFEDKQYILKAPANDSAINILEIISFYKKCNFTPWEIRNSIKNLSWKNQMQQVVNESFNI